MTSYTAVLSKCRGRSQSLQLLGHRRKSKCSLALYPCEKCHCDACDQVLLLIGTYISLFYSLVSNVGVPVCARKYSYPSVRIQVLDVLLVGHTIPHTI